jgi:hypothetical protein
MVRYFEWMGAAHYTADARSGAMHGKQFLMDEVFAGIDEEYVYGRLDFAGKIPEDPFEIVVNLESCAKDSHEAHRSFRLGAAVTESGMVSWQVTQGNEIRSDSSGSARAVLDRNFEFRLPLNWLLVEQEINEVHRTGSADKVTDRIRLRFSLWQHRLPVDALPTEGWIDLELVPEEDLEAISG